MQFYCLTNCVMHEILVLGNATRGNDMQTTNVIQFNLVNTEAYKTIINTRVNNINLNNKLFAGSRIENTVFENVNFVECDFQGTEIIKCKFVNCNFENCNFEFSRIKNCNMVACKVEGCNFCITNSLNTNFLSCMLTANKYEESEHIEATFINSIKEDGTMDEYAMEATTLSYCQVAA